MNKQASTLLTAGQSGHPATRRLLRTALPALLLLALALTGCSTDTTTSATTPTVASGAAVATTPTADSSTPTPSPTKVVPAEQESPDTSEATTIVLADEAISIDGDGASAEGSIVIIDAAGTYTLSGTLSDGQIIVDTKDEDEVVLVLAGVDITCSDSAPIYVAKAETVVINLAAESENTLTDGETYVLADEEEGEPNAAIFSKGDLLISGTGSLSVTARYNDGIASKDGLEIAGGTLDITAVGDGLRGKDYVTIGNAEITIDAGADGIKATHDEDADRGYVVISSGSLTITAAQDGIQAETDLLVQGGTLTLTTGGGSGKASTQTDARGGWQQGPTSTQTDEESAKGLKAGVDLTITDGIIIVDSLDDSVHSNGTLTISGGELTLASGDDGIHADTSLTIDGGTVAISQSYEGIESAEIIINDGNLHIVSSDDGINVSGGADGSSLGGRPGQNNFAAASNQHLEINGGYIYVDAAGDGIDVNGGATMTGGLVLVNGPTNNGNGALDYVSGFQVTGGTLVAVGSPGMAQAPDTSSTQYAVRVNLTAAQAAGTLVHIVSQDDEQVLTFAPSKDYQSIVLSSAALQQGQTYDVYVGGSSTGTVTDGLYTDGTYSGGTLATSFTVTDVVTGVGAGGGIMGGGGGRPGGGR